MPSEVEHVAVPGQTVAYLAVHGSVRKTQEPFARLFAALAAAGLSPAGPPMARFDLDLRDPDDADYEVAVPIAAVGADGGPVPGSIGDVRTGTLPAHYALVTVYRGPYEEIGAGYTALTEALDALGHAVAGPASEVYLVGADSGAAPADFVTEVRVPVAAAL